MIEHDANLHLQTMYLDRWDISIFCAGIKALIRSRKCTGRLWLLCHVLSEQ